MKKSIIIHPFLFAIFPILFLYSYNASQILKSELFIPIAIAIFLTFLFWLLLDLMLKDYKKAGVLVALYLLLFFSYGHLHALIKGFNIAGFTIGRHRYIILTWSLFFAAGTYFIIKVRKSLHSLTGFLNITASSLVAITLINIGSYGLKAKFSSHDNKITGRSTQDVHFNKADFKAGDKLPDIYYIILDGYAGSDTLEEIFGYDNYEFLGYLSDRGFYVAPESRCNYAPTFPSLASALNMAYLDDSSLENDKLLADMIENNEVVQRLKTMGYQYIHFSSTNSALADNRHADIVYKGDYWGGEFGSALLETTMLKIFSTLTCTYIRDNVLFTFEKLAEVPDIELPTFTFAHIIVPHPPYVFDRNGRKYIQNIPSLLRTIWEPRERYLEQLIFANKKAKILVNEILSKSDNPPIIILQGDHGPCFPDDDLEYSPGILNAYYLPNTQKGVLYNSITPVNSFRLIFDLYFGTNYGLLEDKTYIREDYEARYTLLKN